MRRDLNDYERYVFDLDGTLYDQPRLRLIMAVRLVLYYALHPLAVKELFILQHFRKVKDGWTLSSSEDDIISKVAADKGTDTESVRKIVRRWIYDNPLSAMEKTRDDKLLGWIRTLRQNGKKVMIFSDYPAKDKLGALGITVDGIYDPDDERIDELKPSPKGLKVIMEDTGTGADHILMIGDREEKDGQSADACGIDHLILPRKVRKRNNSEIGY